MSPALIRFLTPHGLEAAPYQAESLAAAAVFEPHDGVYTVSNTFQTDRVLKLDAHLDRLEDSARREGIPLLLDRARLRSALRTMIAEANYGGVRFRVTVPRARPEQLIVSIEPFHPLPRDVTEGGVRCITLPHSARRNPAAKTTAWLHDREQYILPPGIFTGLLLDDQGHILEGTSSNFYAILNDEDALRTAGEGVLPGIAQQIVFEVAPPILPLVRIPIHVSEVPNLAEAFLTSSSRGIVPVVEIDGEPVGEGSMGGRTRALQMAYNGWVSAHLEVL